MLQPQSKNFLLFLLKKKILIYFSFSHRHRMTEEEEDAELLSDAKESERLSSITRFEQSPWCKFP
jgi:phage antirepressor YoqD-like protein